MKMERKKKKLVTITLAVAMLLTACGQKEEKRATSMDDHVKLKYYMFGSTAAISQGADEVYEEANKIINEKINAEVDFVVLDGGQFGQKMPVIMSSGETFDLMFTSSWLNDYLTNVTKGALLPLDDLLKEHAPEYYNQIDSKYWDAVRVDGKIYGAINEQIMARQSAFIFRNDFLRETGFDPSKITKFADIDEYFTLLQEKGVSVKDYDYTMSSFSWQYTVQQSLGWEPINSVNIPGSIDDRNPSEIKVFNQFKTPEFIEYITLMTKWSKQNIFHLDRLTGATNSAKKPAIVKAEGTYIPSTWKQGAGADWDGNTDLTIQPYGECFVQPGYVSATLTGISATSKNPERAAMYLNLVNTDPKLYNLLCYGIEGRDYKKVDDKHIEILKNTLYTPNTDWAYGCQFNAFLGKDTPDTAWEEQREYNNNAKVSPLMGFNFDTTNVQTEIANCEAISNEYLTMSQYGMLDPDTNYKEFIQKLDKAGADKIIAEMQKQIDEFIAKK